MNNEIKEILDKLNNSKWEKDTEEITYKILFSNEVYKLLDYITNLQQENEYLKLSNPEMNIEHFRVINENKRKIDNLRKQNKELQQENERLKHQLKVQEDLTIKNRMRKHIYKSRCEKASDKLGNYKHYSTPTEEQNSENEDIVDSALNILQNGSENDE